MKTKSMAVLILTVLGASVVFAAEDESGFRFEGSVGVGGISTHKSSGTRDAAKLNEYQDLDVGAIGIFDIKGRGDDHYLDLFGENLGRDDQYLDLRGGKYTIYKYRLFDDRIVHNWAFDARTPYSGIGSTTLTATLPNLNADTWNRFDFKQKQKNIGGLFEISNNSPWYVRLDANQSKSEGLKLIAGSNGTSPVNGFFDKPFPIDFTTSTVAVEGGYASREGQLSLNVLRSRFSNENELLQWQNAFFGGLDTSTLPPDSGTNKIGINGNLKQLPFGSTLAGRITHAKTTNSFAILGNILSTGGTNPATNPDRATFDGDVVHDTASLSLHSNPSKDVDTRVYWNRIKKENNSPVVNFTGLGTTGLGCGRIVLGATVLDPGDCTTEVLSYKKSNLGADVGYRINPQNRLVFGLDYTDLERERIDFDETKDKRASVEYKNTSSESVSTRVKYQYLQRRSNFLEANAGASANDPEFLNRFIARFDASNVDQNLIKIGVDATPADLWDLSFEGILKHNDYKDTVLGRTKDNRQELYASVGYGDARKFRLLVFADLEYVQYDSLHRTIGTVSSGSGTAPNDTPSGNCQSTFPNCYDPSTPANNSNYNWEATNKDKSYAIGIGADWVPAARWKLSSSLMWQRTYGTVDFTLQSGANPTVREVDIGNYDNTKKTSLNLKCMYKPSEMFEFTGGYAYEKYRFSDIAYDGYAYTIGTGTGASYLSGANAFPEYTVNTLYLIGSYKF